MLGRKGPLLRIEDLTPAEKDRLNREIISDIRVKEIDFSGPMDEHIFDLVQSEVFAEWGIMCPHPDYSLEQSDHPEAKRCGVCQAVLFPNTWLARMRLNAQALE